MFPLFDSLLASTALAAQGKKGFEGVVLGIEAVERKHELVVLAELSRLGLWVDD